MCVYKFLGLIDYICDQVLENQPYPHILYFEKYEFEILNALFFS